MSNRGKRKRKSRPRTRAGALSGGQRASLEAMARGLEITHGRNDLLLAGEPLGWGTVNALLAKGLIEETPGTRTLAGCRYRLTPSGRAKAGGTDA